MTDNIRSDGIFAARRPLGHIRDFARARRVCPWSTLGVVLVHALCQIPPHVVIEPLIGGHAAPNLPVALVGPPGAGKGASEATGRDAIQFTGLSAINIPEFPIGSGEGIARTFADADAETITRAIFSVAEVQTLEALFRRQGSTLEGEIRKLAMGEQLGFANAQKHTRVVVPRLSYRAGLIVGVQPLKAGALLAGADGGTPQRFLWFPVLDAEMPQLRPEPLAPIQIEIPSWPPPDPSKEFVELVVPIVARDAVDAHQYALHRGDTNVDPLDGHALLTRIKVAAALMVLDKRTTISEDDWELSGQITKVSNRTRASVQQAMEQARRRDNRHRALAADERDEFTADRKLTRCKDGVIRWLDKLGDGEQLPCNELRSKLKVDVRDYLGAALAELVDQGVIEEINLSRGCAYRRVQGVPHVHPFSPAKTWGVPVVQGVPTDSVKCQICGGHIGSTGKCVNCIVRKVQSA